MINDEHKDRLFSFLFGREENKKWTLSLYNAVNGSGYTDSDAASSDVEVRVSMRNINYGRNRELMETCRPLSEYAWFVEEIRGNNKNMGIEEAIDRALDDMPENFEIRRFLVGNRAEVKDMCITEYNEAETMQMFKEEGREEGREEGEDRLGELMEQLLSRGRISDAQKAATDKAARTGLYKEFGIV